MQVAADVFGCEVLGLGLGLGLDRVRVRVS